MSPRVRIKFCGFTRAQDLHCAQDLGVDGFGFNLAQGPRKISVSRARELRGLLSPFATAIALVMDQPGVQVISLAAAAGCSVVQLHGSESLETVAWLARRIQVIKALRIASATDIEAAHHFAAAGASALLLDAWSPRAAGGSGEMWDHRWLRGHQFSVPVILAGGLNPSNVAAAIEATGVTAVDVSSGIEQAPGRKDASKMRAFCHAVRNGNENQR